MTTREFSDAFDTLLNSYSATAQFGEEATKQSVALDEYEKSLFLTKAQEEVVLSLYTGKTVTGEAFEGTEELRRHLSNLVAEKRLTPITTSNGSALGVGSSSKFFTLPEDLWYITYESVKVSSGKCGKKSVLKVYPTRQDEYQNIKDNPFRGANDRRALRLDLSEGNVEIICKYPVTEYYVRYLKEVPPIILTDLPDGLKINKESKETECVLHNALHQKILDRAVMLALQSKGYNLNREQR